MNQKYYIMDNEMYAFFGALLMDLIPYKIDLRVHEHSTYINNEGTFLVAFQNDN